MEFKSKSEWLRRPNTREEVILLLDWARGIQSPISLLLSAVQFLILGNSSRNMKLISITPLLASLTTAIPALRKMVDFLVHRSEFSVPTVINHARHIDWRNMGHP